jgi:hypothetical protein
LNSMTKAHWLALLVVWALSIGYMATHLKRGWVPHDEGTLGQSAERVLNGELPHRDFVDYTGGLTLIHALAFHEFGINLASMRIVLFVFFATWVPAIFYVATRFASIYSAGAVTLLAMAWSVPNYPAPMPSWYNLFFATFGTAALLRYLAVSSRRWLVVAGICGGLSILAKTPGAYFVAGAFLFFIFREQSITNEENRGLPARVRFYSATTTLALLVFLALLFSLIHKVPGIRGLIYFFLPAFCLVALLLAREFAGIAGQDRERFARLTGMCLPFGVGVAIPLVAFLVPYVLSGSVHDLIHGLIGTATTAIHFAVSDPEDPVTMVEIIPFILPVIVAYECHRLGRAIWGSILALFGCAVLIFSAKSPLVYGFGWRSLTTAVPVLGLAGVAILWVSRGQQKLSPVRQQQIMLIMCVTVLCSLVQFPFAGPIYFCYVAPLVILLATALFASAAHPPRFVLGALLAFYLLFAVLRVTPAFIYQKGLQHAPDAQTVRITLARAGGLRVDPSDAQLYEELIPLVQSHAEGKFIYAAPDCPEVYFLAGLRSPTRTYFDFSEDPIGHTERILDTIDHLGINVVAINLNPKHSSEMNDELRHALDQRFPHSEEVGDFHVRWKE